MGAVRRRSAPNITFFFKRWRDLGAVTWKASARMLLAAGTSSASHLDLAPISHRTSALGQWATALWSRASKDSLRRRRALQQTPEDGRAAWDRKTVWGKWTWSPGAVILLKVGRSEPHTFLAGEHLQGVSVDGPGALQRSVGHALKHSRRAV